MTVAVVVGMTEHGIHRHFIMVTEAMPHRGSRDVVEATHGLEGVRNRSEQQSERHNNAYDSSHRALHGWKSNTGTRVSLIAQLPIVSRLAGPMLLQRHKVSILESILTLRSKNSHVLFEDFASRSDASGRVRHMRAKQCEDRVPPSTVIVRRNRQR